MHNGIPSVGNSSLVPQDAKIKFPHNLASQLVGGCSPNELKGGPFAGEWTVPFLTILIGRSDSTELDKPIRHKTWK